MKTFEIVDRPERMRGTKNAPSAYALALMATAETGQAVFIPLLKGVTVKTFRSRCGKPPQALRDTYRIHTTIDHLRAGVYVWATKREAQP